MMEMFQYPFMQRAFLAGIFLAGLLSFLGVFVILRRMAFFSDGIAHASLSGIAAGVLAGVNPLATALIAAVLFSIAMFYLEKKARISSDAAIGMIFTSGMAIGVLLMSLKAGYQPELIGFLFGNILAIEIREFWAILSLASVVLLLLFFQARNFTLSALDRNQAFLSGLRPDLYQLVFHVILAIAVVLGIKMLGVVLVSALLIIPVSTAKLISSSFRTLILTSIVISEIVVFAGLFISYVLDLPAGAVIVLTATIFFFAVLFLKHALKKS